MIIEFSKLQKLLKLYDIIIQIILPQYNFFVICY